MHTYAQAIYQYLNKNHYGALDPISKWAHNGSQEITEQAQMVMVWGDLNGLE